MKYKVYECEERTTSTGKQMKSLTLQGEGKQYPDKFVAMWSDHPLFDTIAAGQTIEAELEVKDSNKPNPHGGFYKNKTLLKPGQSPAPVVAPETGNLARLENVIELKVFPLVTRLEAALDRLQAITAFVAGDEAIVAKEVQRKVGEGDGEMPFPDDDVTNKSPF